MSDNKTQVLIFTNETQQGRGGLQQEIIHMRRTMRATLVALLVATTFSASVAEARRNPPGPLGGPGTDWANPAGPIGGPGASPYRWWLGNPPGPIGGPVRGPLWPHRAIPDSWVYWGWYGGLHWYKHSDGYWCRFDNDGNPPGPVGGPGTNWENPPGPIGGPGASPNSPLRPC